MSDLLQGKNIVIYGAGGRLGRGIATTFAGEGANLFLAGRTKGPLEAVEVEADREVLDVLDEQAVHQHAQRVFDTAGSIDVAFNLVSRGDVQRIPLIEMDTDDFVRPIVTGITAQFITAKAVAKHMTAQGSGVILMLDSGSRKGGFPGMGGTSPADAAQDSFLRSLAAEVGPSGVRVMGIYCAGVPETFDGGERTGGMGPEDIENVLGPMTMLKRVQRRHEVADVAAFLASDRASSMTGWIVDASCGLSPT
jgi:NAD(P)-dependent dehydrogenase (short-subunit alcohol dehydrogenase family)